MMGGDTQPEPTPAAQAPEHPSTPERQQKASNVHGLADTRLTRKRVVARAKAIDRLLEGEEEDTSE